MAIDGRRRRFRKLLHHQHQTALRRPRPRPPPRANPRHKLGLRTLAGRELTATTRPKEVTG
jgi:hypothetical protein